MKIFLYIIMAILFLLVTFFGLGPVIMADGSINERIMTLAVVLVLYAIIVWITLLIRKHVK